MRKIKFRAWHKPTLKMYLVDCIDFFIGGLQLRKTPKDTFQSDLSECKLMQFTGLKDKNGKEIWEGDLFKCIYDFDGCTEHIMEVVYDEERAGFHLKSHGESCHQQGVVKHIWDFKRKEVLGNVHENRELLK